MCSNAVETPPPGGPHQAPSALMLCCERYAAGGDDPSDSERWERAPLVELLRSLAEAAADSEEAESEGGVEGSGDSDDEDGGDGGEQQDGQPLSDAQLLAGARSLLPSFVGRALFVQCSRFEQVAPSHANCRMVFDGPGLTASVVTTRAVCAGEQLTLPADG
jgi:hypothetical protein